MPSFPDLVAQRFSTACPTYDQEAQIQALSRHHLVQALQRVCPDFVPASILDAGTGTGELALLLENLYPRARQTLNDLSEKMLALARNKLSCPVRLQKGDMGCTPFALHDLVATHLALQWSQQGLDALKALYSASGKILLFSCLLDRTFTAWFDHLARHGIPRPVPPWPQPGEPEALLVSMGATVLYSKELYFDLSFANSREAVLHLRKTGATASLKRVPPGALRALLHHGSHPVTLHYRILTCIVQRPEA